jgi:hypothetical protein
LLRRHGYRGRISGRGVLYAAAGPGVFAVRIEERIYGSFFAVIPYSSTLNDQAPRTHEGTSLRGAPLIGAVV